MNYGSRFDLRPVLLLTGDSLTEKGTDPATQGWVTLLQSRYIRSTDVITRGLSGYNTKWFLNDVVPLISREIQTEAYNTPSLITVWLGANDASLWNGSNSETHVPIEDYKSNLMKIVASLWTTAPSASILLITPPHINDSARVEIATERNDSKRGLLDRSNAMTKEYADACVETADRIGVPVLDLNSYFNNMPVSERDALLVDGLHLNEVGNAAVDELLRGKIASEFSSLNEDLEAWQSPPASVWVTENPWMATDEP
ncbi:GDSL esterase/lipase [Phytophthora citrophthora]|uniref:GDSL esterase/lipase n=1 Tax=Phytophthora citrophthora TaxID=4793 RepID=A0AAD9LC77_9STRA|nr:GDSL esterase/lipase [Phytophthora citrophthora]